mmetsp:Transcript_3360/g.7589  ORF Transcript_3360/g.7589 Transcript_3360/m.7589 type:complete len:317 (-) Transcript_3360:163-1113(-)
MAARAVVASAAVVAPRKVALIMGVANQRSIAMSCMESFLQKGDWDVVLTVQNERNRERVQRMVEERNKARSGGTGSTLGAFVCDVTDPGSTGLFFRESLPEALDREGKRLEAVVHSIAFAPDLRNPLLETNREAFLDAHEISAYSLIEVARESLPLFRNNNDDDDDDNCGGESDNSKSITTLSYLGADRGIPGYHAMGPAKASLESIVRGLALELGQHRCGNKHNDGCRARGPMVRVNAVRAGPIPTLSSKGGIAGFERMRRDVELRAPLGNVSASQVASTVYHLAAEAGGMTGQTIDVDGGYSIVGGPPPLLQEE